MPNYDDLDYEDDFEDEEKVFQSPAEKLDTLKNQILILNDKISEQQKKVEKLEQKQFIKVYIYYVGTSTSINSKPLEDNNLEEVSKILNFSDVEKIAIKDYIKQINTLLDLKKNKDFFEKESQRIIEEEKLKKQQDMTIFNAIEKVVLDKYKKQKEGSNK